MDCAMTEEREIADWVEEYANGVQDHGDSESLYRAADLIRNQALRIRALEHYIAAMTGQGS